MGIQKVLLKKYVYLVLEFSKPAVVKVVLEFQLAKFCGVVDLIVNAKGVYL